MENVKKYAWYFPNWHPTPLNDKWHGKNWTEWECVKHATPRFEGHIQPKVPLWGYEDESDPKVMEKKIAVAKEYGVTRVCVNPQSLCDEVLHGIGRSHTAEDFLRAFPCYHGLSFFFLRAFLFFLSRKKEEKREILNKKNL